MSSRLASTLSRDGGRYRGAIARAGRRVMSEKEIAAYLAARDIVRRVQGTYGPGEGWSASTARPS